MSQTPTAPRQRGASRPADRSLPSSELLCSWPQSALSWLAHWKFPSHWISTLGLKLTLTQMKMPCTSWQKLRPYLLAKNAYSCSSELAWKISKCVPKWLCSFKLATAAQGGWGLYSNFFCLFLRLSIPCSVFSKHNKNKIKRFHSSAVKEPSLISPILGRVETTYFLVVYGHCPSSMESKPSTA